MQTASCCILFHKT